MQRTLFLFTSAVSVLSFATLALAQVDRDPDAPWYAMLRKVCKDPALVAKVRADFEQQRPPDDAAEFAWKLRVGCEQIDLPVEPRHEAADKSPEASHSGSITSARWSADGRSIISASADGTVRIWETETGKPIKAMQVAQTKPLVGSPKPGIARSALFIGDSGHIAVGADEHPVRLFDIASGQPVAELPLPTSNPGLPVFTRMALASSKLLLIGGFSDEVLAIDMTERQVRYRLTGHQGEVTAVAASETAGLIATAGRGRGGESRVRLWSVDMRQEVAEVSGLGGNASHDALAFSRDGKQLATVTGGRVLVYSIADKRVTREITLHRFFGVTDLAFTADGTGLITCERHPILWAVETGKITRHFGPFTDLCHSVDVSPDGRFIVAASAGSDVRIWEIATGEFYRRLGINVRPPY